MTPPKDATRKPDPNATVYRTMTLEFDRSAEGKRAEGDDDPRIPVAISSESKVERYDWWADERYYEVLDHDPASIDLDYARDGLPFLLDHDSRTQIGLLEDVVVGDDRKVRGLLRMGNHPDAAWAEKDIRGGIRKKVSVGYRLGEYRIEREQFNELPVRRYRWTPIESSSVPIPADYEVGIGRSATPIRFALDDDMADRVATKLAGRYVKESPIDAALIAAAGTDSVVTKAGDGTLTPRTTTTSDIPVAVTEVALEAVAQRTAPADARDSQDPPAPQAKERTMSDVQQPDSAAPVSGSAVAGVDRSTTAAEIARLCNAHELSEKIPEFLSRGLSIDQAKAELFDAKVAAAKRTPPAGHLDLSDREAAQFSYTRAISRLLDKRWEQDGGFEKEVSDTVARRIGKATGGFFVPLDLKVRASVTGNVAGTSSLGGAGVQTTVLSLIDILRNRMLVKQLGARVLSGLTGNITFPRQITANTMAWEGENPSTAHANTAATLDNVALSPKTAMASSSYSRQLLIQESFDVNGFIQDDLATVLALGLDLAALDGTGSANQPTGVMRQTGVTTITHGGSNGGIPTFAEMVSYETNVASNNGDIGSIAWVTTPGVRGKLKTTLQNTTSGAAYIWQNGEVNGYRAEVTNQLPTNYTIGTSTTLAHGIVFGVWSEILIGEWGGALEVVIDPYTSAKQGMVEITQMIMADIGVRHPKSFAISKSALVA